MTDTQKEHINRMRADGLGYLKIARILSLSVNTVKTYCRRNNLCGELEKHDSASVVDYSVSVHCRNCGIPIDQPSGKKQRKFCSDICRVSWWNSHPEKVNRRANYLKVCAYCCKLFTSYGNINRIYCCHACYIGSRFRKDVSNADQRSI